MHAAVMSLQACGATGHQVWAAPWALAGWAPTARVVAAPGTPPTQAPPCPATAPMLPVPSSTLRWYVCATALEQVIGFTGDAPTIFSVW